MPRMLPLILAMLLAVPASAAGGDWILVTRRAGVVTARPAGGNTWLRIIANRRLAGADQARTAEGASAQIRLADGSVLAMGPLTTVQVDRFLRTATAREASFRVESGSARARVAPGAGRFQVATPNAVLAAQGTDFLVEVSEGATRTAVFEGRVLVTDAAGRSALLQEGDTGLVDDVGDFLVNPPSFTFPDAVQSVRAQPGLGPVEGARPGPQFGTITQVGRTGTGFSGHRISDGRGDADGPPVLVNPNAEFQPGGILLVIPRPLPGGR